jgi:hypothetical protein
MRPVEDQYVSFSIFYALGQQKLVGIKRRLTEAERQILAQAVLDHFKLSHWQVMREPVTLHSAPPGREPT